LLKVQSHVEAELLGGSEVDTSSYFVGACTGRSAGLSPRKISARVHAALLEGFSSGWRCDEFDQGLGRIRFFSADQDPTSENGRLLDVRR
jgi:hypothetical protein